MTTGSAFSGRCLPELRRLGAAFALALVVGCDASPSSSTRATYVDASITRFQSLGWLGAHTQPLNQTLTLEVDDARRSVGGVVIRELIPDGPLAEHGVQVADVIVRVGEEWIPVTDDMELLLLESVERAISSGKNPVELGCWRAGTVEAVEIPVDRVALEVGLPLEVTRFEEAAELGANRLRALQQPNGGFAVSAGEQELAIDAIAGLALLATGARPGDTSDRDVALARLDARIRELLTEPGQDVAGLVYGLMYVCEQVGPLPPEVLVAASEAGTSGGASRGASGPAGLPSGITMVQGGSLEDVQKMLAEQLGGQVEVTLEVGSTGSFTSESGTKLDPGMIVGAQPTPASSPPSVGLEALLAEHAVERAATNAAIAPTVAALVEAQDESGHWGAPDRDPFERFLLTSHALVALGMAQRVGLDVPAPAIERGIQALRPLVDDGKLAARVARGADRREESGRAAHVAWALLALGVPERDEFRELLLDFSDDSGRDILRARRGVLFHVWATAATRRGRGLAQWQSFYDDFRVWLVAQQEPSGRFVASSPEPTSLETIGGEVLATAIGTQILAFQSERTPVALARAENPLAPITDGHGKRTSGAADASATPTSETGQPMIITDPAEAAKMLEKLGIDASTLGDGATDPDG